jgi:hypothetical protein
MGNARNIIDSSVGRLKELTVIDNVKGTVTFDEMDMAMRFSLLLAVRIMSARDLGLCPNDEMIGLIVSDYGDWVDENFNYSW